MVVSVNRAKIFDFFTWAYKAAILQKCGKEIFISIYRSLHFASAAWLNYSNLGLRSATYAGLDRSHGSTKLQSVAEQGLISLFVCPSSLFQDSFLLND